MNQTAALKSLGELVRGESFGVHGKYCDVTVHVRSDQLMVTFDNLASIDERSGASGWEPWLAPRAEALGLSILGIQSHQKDWYRTPEPAAQIETLRDSGFFDRFSNILFVGASMGGFAALCFAGLVPGAKVLAFSPQSTLNRDIAPFERRYPWPYRKFDWESPAYLDAAEHLSGVRGHVFFDPHVREDRLHAQRLESEGIRPVKIPFGDHTLIRTIVKSGALEHLLLRLVSHDDLDPAFWHLMRNRRRDETWAKCLLKHVSGRGDGLLARRACMWIADHHGHPVARKTLRKLKSTARAEREANKSRRVHTPFWTDTLDELEIRARIPVFIQAGEDMDALRATLSWFDRFGFARLTIVAPEGLSKKISVEYSASTVERASSTLSVAVVPEDEEALRVAAETPGSEKGFVYTDTDVVLPARADPAFLTHLIELALRHGAEKVGFALGLTPGKVELDRIVRKNRTLEKQQKRNWKEAVENGVYRASIDTSFFVYVPQDGQDAVFNPTGIKQSKIPALRVARRGFIALRRSWLLPGVAG